MGNIADLLTVYQKAPVEERPNRVPANPLVSICVQTYRHEAFIAQCLDGILEQRVPFRFELLIAEDDSDDRTRDICLQYAMRHPDIVRLFFHRRENNIVINKRPSGRFTFLYNLSQARGEYIALCEGDDYWTDPLKLSRQYEALKRYPSCDMCFHPAIETYSDSVLSDRLVCNHADSEYVCDLNEVILGGGSYMPTASLFFKSKVIQRLPFWLSEVPVADTFIQIYSAHRAGALFIPQVMSVYRRFVPGSWTEKNNKSRLVNYDLYRAYIHFYEMVREDYVEYSPMIDYCIAFLSKILLLNDEDHSRTGDSLHNQETSDMIGNQ